ncbi:hypothetical protein HY57_03405 [Dyella japonica A8]|uniref:Uncharacterized protein n=1 Tax=Dyella japonica A8 TaxID=1217721 RepID=A0A075K2B4_9GAMM|nr:hypothetical protein HY57_03405 [Dyella japonica A8]
MVYVFPLPESPTAWYARPFGELLTAEAGPVWQLVYQLVDVGLLIQPVSAVPMGVSRGTATLAGMDTGITCPPPPEHHAALAP